jgi:hypothetical protein
MSYRTIGVKWWGEGAYERQTIDGSRSRESPIRGARKRSHHQQDMGEAWLDRSRFTCSRRMCGFWRIPDI